MHKNPPNPKDLRVIKTRQNIHSSFIHLLGKYDYHEITVAHILAQAQINRTTFYKHYANKHALAQQMINELVNDVLTPLVAQRFEQPVLDFLAKLIDDLSAHYEFIFAFWHLSAPQINLQKATHALISQQYIISHQHIADEHENLSLQGHLYASFAISTLDYLICNHQNICPDELFANARQLMGRIL